MDIVDLAKIQWKLSLNQPNIFRLPKFRNRDVISVENNLEYILNIDKKHLSKVNIIFSPDLRFKKKDFLINYTYIITVRLNKKRNY